MIEDLIPASIFFAIVYIVKIISDNKIRKLAIEKGVVNEDMKYLYSDRYEGKVPASLKWGFVLIGIGLAVFIGQMVPSATEEITVGGMFLFAGLGLVIYYFIANRIYKKAKQEEAR